MPFSLAFAGYSRTAGCFGLKVEACQRRRIEQNELSEAAYRATEFAT